MSDIVDWSDLPKSLFVIGARSADGVVFDVQTCSVPMALAPEVEYVRAAEITRLRSDLAAAQEREQSVAAALRRIATPEAFFVATSNIDPEALGRMIYAQAVLGGASLDEAAAKAEAECKRRAVLGEPQ